MVNDTWTELSELRKANAALQLRLEPKRPALGGTCQALWEHGSVCEGKPDNELFVPIINQKPFVLCTNHCKAAESVFSSLGIFYKRFDHDYKGKQSNLFIEEAK